MVYLSQEGLSELVTLEILGFGSPNRSQGVASVHT
jgi:hypothetical protein